jgi:hypothetical protein
VINANVVGLRYFPTLGVPLLNGRDFAASDTEGAPLVVILNATAATMHFPGAAGDPGQSNCGASPGMTSRSLIARRHSISD